MSVVEVSAAMMPLKDFGGFVSGRARIVRHDGRSPAEPLISGSAGGGTASLYSIDLGGPAPATGDKNNADHQREPCDQPKVSFAHLT